MLQGFTAMVTFIGNSLLFIGLLIDIFVFLPLDHEPLE